jgi:NTE family protein
MSNRARSATVLVVLCLAGSVVLRAAEPRRPRIGLALGGGSAKGLAHIGVLRWFDEHRIPVDVVSGTSMGGLVGGAFATGRTPAEIATQMRETDWDAMFNSDSPFSDKTFRRKEDKRAFPSSLEFGLKHGFRLPNGLNPGQQVELMLDEIALPYYDLRSFDDLPTPFRCVATDLHTAEVIVLGEGRLAEAMRATMSLPGIFSPVEHGDRLLVDGGTLNNVPADVARDMGADVVIAVDVGAETKEEREAQPSMFTLLGQTIDTMMRAWTKRALEAATVVIRPQLDGLNSLSYRQSDEVAERGYQAAEQLAGTLLQYAVSEEEYRKYLATRESRRRTKRPTLLSIEVRGVPDGEQQFVRRALTGNLGKPIDSRRVAHDILRVSGTDRYECLTYWIVSGPLGAGLVVDVRLKSYGPPFLAMSLNANSADSSNFSLDVAGRLTMYDTFGRGSEVRVDATVGTRKRAYVEVYRPIGNSRLFVAPRGGFDVTSSNVYASGAWIGEYRVGWAGAGVDLGVDAGRRVEMRLGYDVMHLDGRVHVGDPTLPEVEGAEQFATASLAYDGQDAPVVPSRGVYARAAVRRFFSSAGIVTASGAPLDMPNPRSFWQAEVGGSWFQRVNSRDRLFSVFGAGTSFGAEPLIDGFSLGGPFRLGAYNTDELGGSNYLLGTIGWLRRLTRLPDFVGGNISAGGWLEGGSAFRGLASAEWHGNASAGLILETMLGPIFVGGSLGFDGHNRLYVSIGQMFR